MYKIESGVIIIELKDSYYQLPSPSMFIFFFPLHELTHISSFAVQQKTA